MKYTSAPSRRVADWSLPVRGAWIEIAFAESANVSVMSLPVRGAWIEMLLMLLAAMVCIGRSPCGERGLK